MKEIDWSKAPEGANYRDAGGNWLRFKNNQWFAWSGASGGYWFTIGKHNLQKPLKQKAIGRITSGVPLSDEGLPPAGTVCEIAPPYRDNGTKVRVLCRDEGDAICRLIEGDELGDIRQYMASELRPIRTPEQIAAEERALAIQQMCEDAGKPDMPLRAREQAGMLYDAGWRKQEQPK